MAVKGKRGVKAEEKAAVAPSNGWELGRKRGDCRSTLQHRDAAKSTNRPCKRRETAGVVNLSNIKNRAASESWRSPSIWLFFSTRGKGPRITVCLRETAGLRDLSIIPLNAEKGSWAYLGLLLKLGGGHEANLPIHYLREMLESRRGQQKKRGTKTMSRNHALGNREKTKR